MSQSTIALLLLAFVLANAPFLSDRIFWIKPTRSGKSAGWCLLELLILYVVVGGSAWLMESRVGQVQHQNWEFYAITVCMFLVFAYPGFVYRYLWRRLSD